MKIGFVFDDSLDRNDGVQQYIKTIADWMMEQGHEVRFLVGETRDAGIYQPFVYSLAKNINVRANKNRLSIPLPITKRRIEEILGKENFDILHVQAPFSPMFAAKVIRSALPSCGIVATFHIVESSLKERIGIRVLRTFERRSLRRINVNLANSTASKSSAEKYFIGSVFISPCPVRTDRFAVKARRSGPNWNLGFLGRLVERKGCLILLQAVQRISINRPDIEWMLRIAGDGPLRRRLEKFVDTSGLRARVRFLGFIDEPAKPQFLADSDIAIFPALYGESFGIVLLEAMAAGTLTLGGDNPGYRTVLEGREDSLFTANQPLELADLLIRLYDNPSIRRDLLAWQRDRIKLFDIGTVGPQLLSHYRQAQTEARACQSAP